MVVLFLFEVGFTMLVMAINQPYKPSMDLTNDEEITEKLLVQELELCKLVSYVIPEMLNRVVDESY